MKSLAKIALTVFTLGIMTLPGFADTVTETTTTVTTIRTDAPIYMGPVQNVGELQELTLEDFQRFGTKPSASFDLFQEYQEELRNPGPNSPMVIYKMRIVDRDLVLADFQGSNVLPELAQARYQEYLKVDPTPMDGRNVRYVFVYHTPLMNRS